MDWQSHCAAVIPCLNEARAIGSVVRGVREQLRTVFVVDDGSEDRTADEAQQAGGVVLRHETRQGKGASLLEGWAWAQQRHFSWVLSLDGDGQHMPEDIPRFFAEAEKSAAALIAGSRMAALGQIPWVRRQVNLWMSARISRLAGRRLEDTQCGFRLMRLDSYSSLRINVRRFEIESEVLLAFARAGFEIRFVPIHVVYDLERSKIRPFSDTVRWLGWYRRALFARPEKDSAHRR